ncbi:peptidylprolyl isomerase [bacterium]|nr:peptidylprolyl isomerase [bacterium]
MRGKKLLATLALSTVLFAGCGLKSGDTIITVNDKKITQAQFDKMFDEQASGGIAKALGINVKDGKNTFMYLLIKERVVNELIIKALLEDEIEKRGIEVTNSDVENAIKDIIDKLGSKEQLDAVLKQNAISNSQFKNDLKEEIKMKKLSEQLGSAKVTDADTKKFYNDNIDKFKHPARVRASHILISANPEEIKEIIKSDKANESLDDKAIDEKVNTEIKAKETKANQLLKEAKKDVKQFAKLAKENSEDTTTAVKGGDLGFFTDKEMVPEFSKAAFAGKPNTVYDKVVKTQYGYHIILVTDRAAAGTEPYEKVKNDIKAYLETQKQLEAIDKLVDSLKKNADIKYIKSDYNPEQIQKDVQQTVKEQTEKDKKEIEKAKKEKKSK